MGTATSYRVSGAFISTVMTVASAAPGYRPDSEIATARSKKYEVLSMRGVEKKSTCSACFQGSLPCSDLMSVVY